MAATKGRIRKELAECQKDVETTGVCAEMKSNQMDHLVGKIQGPPGTPYEGGEFLVDIKVPQNYPFEPPIMQFTTKIWHPNVSSQTGAICLDILKDQWSPALTIKTALLSIQALLSAAEPTDPQDAQVASMYMNDHETFLSTAKFWTESYARPRSDDIDPTILNRLCDMGFSKDAATKALKDHNGDENAALETLLSGV